MQSTGQKIDIVTEPLPPGWQWSPDRAWKGTEEFYVETASALASSGHSVQVFYDGVRRKYRGVSYVPRSLFASLWQSDAVLLACNDHPDPQRASPYLRRVRWSNFNHERLETLPGALGYDAHVCISQFHASQFAMGLQDEDLLGRLKIIGHGFRPDLYSFHENKEPVILFSSSPDRGQDFLQSIAGEVFSATGYRFDFAYRGLPEEEMIRKYARADLGVHPGLGVELFCIAALKAQVSGCIPVVVPNGALRETVKAGVFALDRDEMASKIIEIIKDPAQKAKIRADLGQIAHKTWADVTKELENALFND
jgi:hypothetical protein